MTTTTTPTTQTLAVPGATLTYDVRRNDASTEPILFLIGSPMGAAGFGTLAGHFTDRTVMTYDPRGSERSQKTDPMSPSTPDDHGDDLHRLIEAVGRGPVDLFASSGGAVNALALVAKHPEDVRTLIAHEPPLASILPDSEHAKAAVRAISETYQRSGWGAEWLTSSRSSAISGQFPADIGQSAGAGPGDVRYADRGRRLAHRRDARPEHHHRHPLRARLRRASGRLDADRPGGRCGVRRRDGEPWRLCHGGATRHRAGGPPAIMAASSAASTARPVTRTRLRRSCARFSPPAPD